MAATSLMVAGAAQRALRPVRGASARRMSTFSDLLVKNASVWLPEVAEYPKKDILVSAKTGKITRVTPASPNESKTIEGLQVIDAKGGLVSPTFAEPHLHLDAVLLGKEWPNNSGTLVEGIANWKVAKEGITIEDVHERARLAVKWMVACGTTRVRTHADTSCKTGVEALVDLKQQIASENLAEIQIVGFPQDGIFTTPAHSEELKWAAEAGIDCIGAIPHLERTNEEASSSLRFCFDLAEKYGKAVDIHCDETDDPHSRHIETVCALTEDRSMGGQVVAGHCTAMHSYNGPAANKVITAIGRSGVQIVTNPLDSIVLQGRFDNYPKRRGLTRVPELLEAGNFVGVGHDSVVDPWYPLGVGNIMDAASMLVHVCHLTGKAEMRRVFQMLVSDNHQPFGGAPKLEEGHAASFLIHSLDNPIDILRTRRLPRYVIGGANVIASNEPPKSTVHNEAVDIGVF